MKYSPNLQSQLIRNIRSHSSTLNDRSRSSTFITVQYVGRDRTTGLRAISTANGGTQYGLYQSNSVPKEYPPLVSRAMLGLAGFIDQRPT